MLSAFAGLLFLAAEPELVVARPADNGDAPRNPGMGWVLHYYDNVPANYGSRLAPADTVDDFPGLSCVYLRIPWSWLEPEEGRFDWSVLDTPAQRWLQRGCSVALRISCTESWTRWATPQWVADAGAVGYNFTPGTGEDPNGPHWEPDYDDPIFLAKLDAFLAALAARYDGRDDVAFIDVGSYGVWGEGHTWASTKKQWPAATLIRHIDLHRRHFPNTLLAANDDFAGAGEEVIQYAAQAGLTLRDDSILVQPPPRAFFHANFAQAFWPSVPVILESEHYGGSRDRGYWGDGSEYLRAVEEYHASYASIHWWPREYLTEQRPQIDAINQRLGYRLQLVEASWPATARLGGLIPWRCVWRNAGVAPCYPGGRVAFTLKDSDGGLVAVFVLPEFDVRRLPVGPPGGAETMPAGADLALPFQCPAGEFEVFVSVGDDLGTPRIGLPLDGDDGARRYRLGTIRVQGDYAAEIGEPRPVGDGWELPVTWRLHGDPVPGIEAFCHLEEPGRPLLAGPGPGELTAATESHALRLPLPADAAGHSFELLIGLWLPARIGQEDERLRPDLGQGDRRIRVGRVTVAADGAVTLTR